ncbi:hypothetical protein AXW67_18955 [Bradyrhizobium neotropicale]|uniref:Uncharacterized protein n=1 Tax=Bradyrhizobium neotropicale TaxID=1497615 RepID=A0A176YZA2_9BRAD|nr:hypothetical protein AXW67_18955 [Bradyrhizobium neotropicale]
MSSPEFCRLVASGFRRRLCAGEIRQWVLFVDGSSAYHYSTESRLMTMLEHGAQHSSRSPARGASVERPKLPIIAYKGIAAAKASRLWPLTAAPQLKELCGKVGDDGLR